MTELLPICEISRDRVYAEIGALLRVGAEGPQRAELRTFLAAVDWSSRAEANPDVVRLLGDLEGWTTNADEGELELVEYIGKLLSALPVGREVTVTLDGVAITAHTGLIIAVRGAQDRSVQRPRTELATRQTALAL